MFKDLPDGFTHYVGDGCNPSHPPFPPVREEHTAEEIIQLKNNTNTLQRLAMILRDGIGKNKILLKKLNKKN